MHVCCQDEWAVDTELSSHVVHGSSPCSMTAWLLASAQPMLRSRLLFLSLFRRFYSHHFCHSSWDLNNDRTDLLPHGSTSLRLQLLWSLVRKQLCLWHSFIPHLPKALQWNDWRRSWLHWLCTRNAESKQLQMDLRPFSTVTLLLCLLRIDDVGRHLQELLGFII